MTSVRTRRNPVDLAPVLAAVTNDWEPGKVIAQRAGIDPRTAGLRLAALERAGDVEYQQDAELDVRVYRRKLPSSVEVAVVDEPRVAVTETSWVPLVPLSFEEWHDAGQQLQRIARSVNWLLGDWLAWGESRYGETYSQAIEDTGLEQQTLMNVASVARRVAPELRRETLSWSHHEAVASLEPADQEKYLDEAERDGLSVKRLRSRLNGTPKDAPDPEAQLAATHMGQIRFKLTAESNDDAHARVKKLAALLDRHGVQVCHKRAEAL